MKRIFCFVFAVLLSALTFTSCLVEDAYGLYTTVMDSTRDTSAAEGSFEVKANVTVGGMSVGMTFDGNVQYIVHSETDLDMALNLHMNLGSLFAGGDQDMSMYYVDGWQYTSSADQKVKTEMPLDELLKEQDLSKNSAFEMFKFDPSIIVDSGTSKIDGGKKIFFELDGEKAFASLKEQYEEALDTELDMDDLGSLFSGAAGDFNLGNIQYTLFIDKDNILCGASVLCSVEFGEDYAVEVEFNLKDLSFDSFTEIDLPDDLDEYSEPGSWIVDPDDYSGLGENYFDDDYNDYDYWDNDLFGNMNF